MVGKCCLFVLHQIFSIDGIVLGERFPRKVHRPVKVRNSASRTTTPTFSAGFLCFDPDENKQGVIEPCLGGNILAKPANSLQMQN